jgi:hypothetical protein
MSKNTTRKTIRAHVVGQVPAAGIREVSELGAFEDE